MQVSLPTKMFCILILCPVLLAGGVQTLTIDSQLGTSIEDCFERISIGEQLPATAIYRNVSELTTRECEQICKQDKQCQSYDYGVGAKGNATCNLGNIDEKELKEKSLLLRHPDYDVYVRLIGCEQSPPSPIQHDEPNKPESDDKPEIHRPVFRPVDEKPDYLISTDLGSYNRPLSDERPDDYANPKPEYDSPPSYGSHRPQDIPYRPDKPKPDPYDELQFQDPYRPQSRPPYVTEKPEYHYIVRPNRKPRPQDVGYGRPDQNRPDPVPVGPPNRPYNDRPYRPSHSGQYAGNYGQYEDNSIYLEINDPIRPYKPSRPIYNQGIYGFGSYSSQNSYAQNSQSHYYGSVAESGYGNQKPISKPQRPSYGSNLDDSYGPKPQKPGYGTPSTDNPDGYDPKPGYGSASSDFDTGYVSKPQKPGYGSASSDVDSGYRPKPEKPGYGNPSSEYSEGYGPKPQKPGYGSSNLNYDSGYRPKPQKPSYGSPTTDEYLSYDPKPQKPGYGSPTTDDYLSYDPKPHKPGYGSSNSNGYNDYRPQSSGYGGPTPDYSDGYRPKPQKPGYGSSSADPFDSYGPKPQRPAYGSPSSDISDSYVPKPQKPAYGSSTNDDYGGYKPQKPGYGPPNLDNSDSYGPRPQKPGYGNDKPSYGASASYNSQSESSSNQQSYGTSQYYGSNRPLNQDSGYGSKPSNNYKPSYNNQGSYGDQGSYGSSQGSYGGDSLSQNQGSYGSQSNHGTYGTSSGGYGSNQGSHGSSGYGSNEGTSNQQGGYGSSQGGYGFSQASYGSSQSSQSSNSYFGSTFNENKPSYGGGSSLGSYDDNQGSQGSYGSNDFTKPPYGNNRPYDDKPGYQKPQKPKPTYGTESDGYGNRPSYDKDRPDHVDPGYGDNLEEPGYGSKPSYEKPNKTGYYPDLKPVYEYEMEKPNAPSYIVRPNGDIVTSRPMVIGDFGAPEYGREPGKEVSYKGKCYYVNYSNYESGGSQRGL